MTTTHIHSGSFFQAVTLCQAFKLSTDKRSEEAQVAIFLDQAVDFLTGLTPQLLAGYSLLKYEPRAYVGYLEECVLSATTAPEIAAHPLPGDSLGLVPVLARAQTTRKLDTLAKAFNLASTADAARLAMTVFSTLQQVPVNYGKIYMKNGSEKADINFSRLTSKGN